MHFGGVHCAFLEGEICILGGAICIWGGTLCILGGCGLHFRGYTLHSWRVRFAFWGVHCIPGIQCIFRGYIIHFGGYTWHFVCILCILGGCTFTLGGALCIFGVYLSLWIVGTLCFLGIYSTHNKQIHGWGFILWVHCIFGLLFCA